MHKVEWSQFKNFVSERSLSIQYIDLNYKYEMKAFDGIFHLECELDKNPSDTTDLLDFETNYKPNGNKKISLVDSLGLPLYKNQVVGDEWHYEPRCFDYFVGKYNSLYNRKRDGNGSIESAIDYNDATMKFYANDGTELIKGESETDEEFQDRLDLNCYMTDVIWTPTYDRKCIGANIQINNSPNWSCYLWSDVDLTAIGLGFIPYLAGGLNLQFLTDGNSFQIDARTANDSALPAYIPIVFRCRHDIINDDSRFGLQIFLEHYRP